MRKGTGASAGIIALLALFLHTQLPPSSETPAPGRDVSGAGSTEGGRGRGGASDELPVDGPWLATEAFFHVASSRMRPSPGDPTYHSLVDKLLSADKKPNGKELHDLLGLPDQAPNMWSIVATVADPVHTRMSLFFDGQTEAIERSLQESGWDFAGQWLPSVSRAEAAEKDINESRRQKWMQRVQEELPGILIFRRKPARDATAFPKDVLFVLLVPETVTGGVNGPAFHAAMHLADALSNPLDHKIGLLSPTFSGSFSSLTALLKSWKPLGNQGDHSLHDTVYSGDIANFESANVFSLETGLIFHGGSFDSLDYQQVVCEVLDRYNLDGYNNDKSFVALLKEDEGGLASSLLPSKDRALLATRSSESEGNVCKFRTYVFPRDIAHLRNAYDETAGGNARLSVPESSQGVNFSIKDPTSGEDSIPVFSAVQTPLSQNAIITSITRDLNRAHIRLVFIAATNSLDALFLMRAVRRDCPNTRTLIENPNILFVSAAGHDPLSGTLLLSTYPMFFTAPQGSPGEVNEQDNLMFSESAIQGLYNVTQLLWNELDPSSHPRPRGYSRPSGGAKYPGVWLLTLTPFGFFPVDLFEQPPVKTETLDKPEGSAVYHSWFKESESDPFPVPKAVKPSRAWAVTAFIVSGWILLACLVLLVRNFSPGLGKPLWLVLSDRYRSRLQALTGACFSLSALMWVIALPEWLPWRNLFHRNQTLFNILDGVTLLAALAPVLSLGLLLLRLRSRKVLTLGAIRGVNDREKIYGAMFCLGALAVLADVVILWYRLCSDPTQPNYSLFFRFRALDLFSGASPALPIALLCIVACMISVFALKRHSVAGAGRVRLEFPANIHTGNAEADDRANAFQNRMAQACQEIHERAEPAISTGGRGIGWREGVSVVAVAAYFITVLKVYAAAFELPSYNSWLLFPGIALLLFCLTAGCYDLFYLWASVEKFLRLIELFPLQQAVKRIARDWPRRPIWASSRSASSESIDRQMLYALHRRVVILETRRSVRTLVAAVGGNADSSAAETHTPVYTTTAAEAKKQVDVFSEVAMSSPKTDVEGFLGNLNKYQEVSARIASEVHQRDLRPAWRKSLNEEDELPTTSSEQDRLDQKYLTYSSEVVALQLCRFLNYSVGQIQRMASCVSLSFLLLIAVFNSYRPLGPQFVAQILATVFVAIGFVVVRVFARMERNPILSRIARTQPGELNRDFWIQLVTLGGLPLLGVLTHLFPAISTFLVQWVAPSLQGMH